MSVADATTKGAILRSLLKFLVKDLSAEQYARVMTALPLSDRAVIERTPIMATDKISEFTLNRLTIESARQKGEPVESFGRRAGRAELYDAVGVYRFFVLVLTPTALLKKAAGMWSTVHSHGNLRVENESTGTARLRLTDFPSEEAHCARLTGWMEGSAVLTKVRNARIVHDVCMTRGAADCQWQLTWGT